MTQVPHHRAQLRCSDGAVTCRTPLHITTPGEATRRQCCAEMRAWHRGWHPPFLSNKLNRHSAKQLVRGRRTCLPHCMAPPHQPAHSRGHPRTNLNASLNCRRHSSQRVSQRTTERLRRSDTAQRAHNHSTARRMLPYLRYLLFVQQLIHVDLGRCVTGGVCRACRSCACRRHRGGTGSCMPASSRRVHCHACPVRRTA